MCDQKITAFTAIAHDNDNISVTRRDDGVVYTTSRDYQNFSTLAEDGDNFYTTMEGVHDFATNLEDSDNVTITEVDTQDAVTAGANYNFYYTTTKKIRICRDRGDKNDVYTEVGDHPIVRSFVLIIKDDNNVHTTAGNVTYAIYSIEPLSSFD